MKFFAAALTTALAFATVSIAAKDAPAATTDGLNSVSVYAVLATALPTSLLDLAITNPSEATKVIASEFASGATPAWFHNLPSNIQTYLVPVTTINQAPGLVGSAFPSLATVLQTVPLPSSAVYPKNSTMFHNTTTAHRNHTMSRTFTLPTSTTTFSSSAVTTAAAQSTSSSKGGAAAPTAVIGAGLAGAIGLIGMLAL